MGERSNGVLDGGMDGGRKGVIDGWMDERSK